MEEVIQGAAAKTKPGRGYHAAYQGSSHLGFLQGGEDGCAGPRRIEVAERRQFPPTVCVVTESHARDRVAGVTPGITCWSSVAGVALGGSEVGSRLGGKLGVTSRLYLA